MSQSQQDEPLIRPDVADSRRSIPAPPDTPSFDAYETWLDSLQQLQFPISVLRDQSLVEEFAANMLAATRTWSADHLRDLDKLHDRADRYRELRSRLLKLAPDLELLESDDLLLDIGELRLLFSERDDLVRHLEEITWLKDYWSSYCESRQKIQQALEPRFKQIETVLDSFIDKHKLPPVALKIAEDSGQSDDFGSYSQGTISINLYLLASSVLASELVDTLYHELVHGEQDALILRCVADRIEHKSSNATDEDLDRIEIVYRESLQLSDWPSCRPFMTGVLAQRRGVELTVQEQWRAAYLIAAWHKGRCVIEKESEIVERHADAMTIQQRLGTLSEVSSILKLIGETRHFKSAMCDSTELPAELAALVEAARSNDWQPLGVKSSVIARDALLNMVRERVDYLQSRMDDIWADYRLTHDENEAWAIGTQARLTAERLLTVAPS